jgi:diguanylate cyclase (GGDEF)-like protein
MGRQSGPNALCPVGQDNCAVLEEIARLREERDHLLQLSITDPLTELFNYRHLVASLDQEMERTRRTGLPTGFIMIDLDHFKQVNDTHGHNAGDLALRWASRIFRENIRRIDIPCRYGGEEFAIILPGTDLDQATHLAERLRRILSNSPLEFESQPIALTASFGVISYRGQNTSSIERFFDCADHMLFRAKMQGRNRVCSDAVEIAKSCTEVTSEERAVLYGSDEPEEQEQNSGEGLQEE